MQIRAVPPVEGVREAEDEKAAENQRAGEDGKADRTPGRLGFKRPSRPVSEPFDYLVLLLRSSANLGSGVSGGRCGLTTSLNQASC